MINSLLGGPFPIIFVFVWLLFAQINNSSLKSLTLSSSNLGREEHWRHHRPDHRHVKEQHNDQPQKLNMSYLCRDWTSNEPSYQFHKSTLMLSDVLSDFNVAALETGFRLSSHWPPSAGDQTMSVSVSWI